MIQLFVRTAVTVAAVACITLVVGRTLLDSPPDRVGLRMLGGHAQLLAARIADTPPSERRQVAKELSNTLGYPVSLEVATGGQALRALWRAGDLFVAAQVPGTEGQVVLGPVPFERSIELWLGMALAVVLAVLAAAWMTRTVGNRVAAHEAVASRMCAGDFSAHAERIEGDALDGIGASLNQLAERIDQLLSDERDLLRTVAHEVRAPIARMHFRVERIHDRAGEESRRDSTGLLGDLAQVDSLFEELLTYVAFDEFDHERPELQTGTIDVHDAVQRLADELASASDATTIEVTGGGRPAVIANAKLFDRAVTNLLRNALNYGGPHIRVELREFSSEVTVDVQDRGPGIPEADRPRVIKPFVRLSKKKTEGTGLGLAIVSRIMRLHGGRLHLLDAPTGGASVQLVWQSALPRPRRRWRLPLHASE